jgi:hypothetical protein
MEHKFKKYEDILQEKEQLEIERIVEETFYEIDEGFLSNFKKLGLWKGLKLSLGKTFGDLMSYIKDNPKLKNDFIGFAKKVGKDAAEDAGNIIGDVVKGYEEKIKKLEEEMAELSKKTAK